MKQLHDNSQEVFLVANQELKSPLDRNPVDQLHRLR